MSRHNSILTTKDFTILEIMLDRLSDPDAPMDRFLREKIRSAIVMLREDIPSDVATLGSRLRFRVDGGVSETRVLSHAPIGAPVGMFLPITVPRGLALLGLGENQEIEMETAGGRRERLVLEKILYQPEAERAARTEAATPTARRAALRVVSGSPSPDLQRLARLGGGITAGEDPGPPAA